MKIPISYIITIMILSHPSARISESIHQFKYLQGACYIHLGELTCMYITLQFFLYILRTKFYNLCSDSRELYIYISPYNMCFEHELVMQINYSELLYGVSCSARMLERVIPRKYARREVYYNVFTNFNRKQERRHRALRKSTI